MPLFDLPDSEILACIQHLPLAIRGVGVFALFPPLAELLLDNPLSNGAAEEFDGLATAGS